MEQGLRELIRKRAGDRCEYCQQPSASPIGLTARLQIEHIIARQHRGKTEAENLALACIRCNLFKGPNLTGIDPETEKTVRLFHPRQDSWSEHFRFEGPYVVGLTPIGRTTVVTLNMNEPARLDRRERLMNAGRFFNR